VIGSQHIDGGRRDSPDIATMFLCVFLQEMVREQQRPLWSRMAPLWKTLGDSRVFLELSVAIARPRSVGRRIGAFTSNRLCPANTLNFPEGRAKPDRFVILMSLISSRRAYRLPSLNRPSRARTGEGAFLYQLRFDEQSQRGASF
jgi:hypothetical protein